MSEAPIEELWRLDATELADLVRRGDATPTELTEQAIARIDALNPAVNAVIEPLFEEARASASTVDRAAPFAGVPILVKDASLQLEGTRYACGIGALREIDHRSSETSELARRLLAAGFIILGKTNVPECSSGVTTEPAAFGATRNPWDPQRVAGGSSGGSAAAVAAGMAPLAHGADATGSLRYPASACGVATLKPTVGRVPSATPFGESDSLGVWTEFALARSVRDLRGLLDAVGDAPARSVARDAPYRVGLLLDDPLTRLPLHDDCREAVETTGRALDALGHHVEVTHPPALDTLFAPEGAVHAALVLGASANAAAQLERIEAILGRPLAEGELPASRLASAVAGREADANAVAATRMSLDTALRPLIEWFEPPEAFDLLVTPSLRQPPWPLGNTESGAVEAGIFPAPFSFSGQPAVSLPLHHSAAGLPIGVQLVGPLESDEWLLEVSASLEEALPWRDRWPDVALGASR
jgi:amidase